MSSKLILMRHGRSAWNGLNLFTGWVDIPLDEKGIQESLAAGEKIRNVSIDIVFTSALVRAQMTVALSLLGHSSKKVPLFLHPKEAWADIHNEEARQSTLPVHLSSALNERMYGKLQGLNKGLAAAQFGVEQVQTWRRSFAVRPPGGESLKDTCERAWPYFQKEILPHLEQDKNVLIVAHGNSLRGIIMHLDRLSEEEVVTLEIATGEPLFYAYEKGVWSK